MICRYKIKFISDIEQKIRKLLVNIAVAPFVGVWIEICWVMSSMNIIYVAPFVGVWIEMIVQTPAASCLPVAPFVGVWIEITLITNVFPQSTVAPFVGVWIEIISYCSNYCLNCGRSLRGSVD